METKVNPFLPNIHFWNLLENVKKRKVFQYFQAGAKGNIVKKRVN